MRKSGFADSQTIDILKQGEAGETSVQVRDGGPQSAIVSILRQE